MTPSRFRFGDYVLDTGLRELRRGDEVVHLAPKDFSLLEFLLKNRPNAVAKAKLFEDVWPGTFVSEVTLASHIARVRAAIRDSSENPQFIRTVHGYGYAFCGEVEKSAEPDSPDLPSFCLVVGDREIALSEGQNFVGRTRECAAFFDDSSVSRQHARIAIDGERAVLEDLKSKNGTYRKGKRISEKVTLLDGDPIEFGCV